MIERIKKVQGFSLLIIGKINTLCYITVGASIVYHSLFQFEGVKNVIGLKLTYFLVYSFFGLFLFPSLAKAIIRDLPLLIKLPAATQINKNVSTVGNLINILRYFQLFLALIFSYLLSISFIYLSLYQIFMLYKNGESGFQKHFQ